MLIIGRFCLTLVIAFVAITASASDFEISVDRYQSEESSSLEQLLSGSSGRETSILLIEQRTDGAKSPTAKCCKICKKGKACGDSCISRSKTCHKGPGCACDA